MGSAKVPSVLEQHLDSAGTARFGWELQCSVLHQNKAWLRAQQLCPKEHDKPMGIKADNGMEPRDLHGNCSRKEWESCCSQREFNLI